MSIEMWAFIELGGYAPLEAMACCSTIGAECVWLQDKVGTLEKGKLADILLVDGNPLKDIKLFASKENIRLVMKGGRVEVNRSVHEA